MHFPTIDFRGQLTDLMSLERSTGTPWEHPWEAACPTSPQPWRSLAWPYDGHALSGACWNRNLTMDTSWGWCRTPGDHQLGFAIFSPMIYRVKCTIPTVVFSPDVWTMNSITLRKKHPTSFAGPSVWAALSTSTTKVKPQQGRQWWRYIFSENNDDPKKAPWTPMLLMFFSSIPRRKNNGGNCGGNPTWSAPPPQGGFRHFYCSSLTN